MKTCLAEAPDDYLRKFYQGLKKKNGETYQRSSYLCAGSALQRHLWSLTRPLDFHSASLKRNNEVLDAVLKRNKAQEYCKPLQHKDVLTEEDRVRLNSYFADVLEADDTYKLRSFCWYNMARHFGLRGGEAFAKLKKNIWRFGRGRMAMS